MEFTEALKAFLEVGMLGLCAIMMIVIFWENHKRQTENDTEKNKTISDNNKFVEQKLDNMIDVIKTQNDNVITTIQNQNDFFMKTQEQHYIQQQENNRQLINAIINGVTTHVPSVEENDKLTKVSEEIDNLLQVMLIETKASRVSLVQYHNGGKGVNKQSFLKMSMTNEQVQLGVKPFITDFKDQFRSVLAYFVGKLNTDGYCYIKDAEELINVDTSMYEFMKTRGIKSKFGYAVRGPEGNVIAFLCIEFIENSAEKADINKITNCFKEHHKVFDALLNM